MAVPVITPGGPLTLRGKAVQNFTATNGVTTWSTTGGVLSGQTSSAATWTAPNVTGSYTVTATNVDGSDVVTITITAEVPAYWSYNSPATHKKKVLLFEPESGARQYRQKRGKKAVYELSGVENTNAEYLEIEAFWDAHHPGKQFYFNDVILARESLYQIDSDIKYSPVSGYDRIQWSMVIVEV